VADDVTAPVGPHADAATSPHAGAASRTTREAAPAAGGGARRRGPLSASARKRLEILFFVAPAMALFVVFIVTPVVQAVRYSAFNWNGLGPLDDFVGLQNYANALRDTIFTDAVLNNFFIIAASIAIQLPLGLAIALLLNREIWGRTALRVIIFVPYVLAEVVAGVIWFMLLQPRGIMDALFATVGLEEYTQLWLGDPDIALFTVMVVLTWKYVGLAIILFLAGLQGVPADLYEAAQLDGASWWQVQRRITIPLLGPTIRTWGFLSMIGSLQLFDMVWILTKGGPANSTMTMAVYLINQGTNRSLYGYASAVAVILFVISLVLAALYQYFILRRDNPDAPQPRKARR